MRLRDNQRICGPAGAFHAGAADAVTHFEPFSRFDAIADVDACPDLLAVVRVALRLRAAFAAGIALIADRFFGQRWLSRQQRINSQHWLVCIHRLRRSGWSSPP